MTTRLAINPDLNSINEIVGWFDTTGIEPWANEAGTRLLWLLKTGEWIGEIRPSFGLPARRTIITADEALRWMILHGFGDETIDAHFPGAPRQSIPDPRDA